MTTPDVRKRKVGKKIKKGIKKRKKISLISARFAAHKHTQLQDLSNCFPYACGN